MPDGASPQGSRFWHWKNTRTWLPFLVPIIYLAFLFALQPASRLGGPESWPALGRLVYDDYDVTAFALRGLNIEMGRAPGRRDDPCGHRQPFSNIRASTASIGDEPFYLEYPPAATLLFRIPFWLTPLVAESNVVPAVLNVCHNDVVEHVPTNETELELWVKFRQATTFYAATGILCLLALMLVMYVGYLPDGGLRGPLPLLILPATLYFAANRFDIVPALFMALAFAALGRRWIILSAVLLGLATMLKVYPGLSALLLLRFLGGQRREMFTWACAYVLTLAATLAPSVMAWGWDATLAPYAVQLSRTAEPLSFYGPVFPSALGGSAWWAKAFRLGTVLVVLAILMRHEPKDLLGLLRRSAIVLVVFVALQVFYSPQWILWLVPLLIPLAGSDRVLYAMVAALDITTYVTFPYAFDFRWELLGTLTYVRAVMLAALVWRLAAMERPASTSAPLLRR